ncbi:hypothetical protein HYQ46_004889 [Verticillium longisporum]|nr:hypothetical protein HYQ46_004889 [Verticillium longisporum]
MSFPSDSSGPSRCRSSSSQHAETLTSPQSHALRAPCCVPAHRTVSLILVKYESPTNPKVNPRQDTRLSTASPGSAGVSHRFGTQTSSHIRLSGALALHHSA